jgi:ComF family protein
LDVLFPISCLSCGVDDIWLCENCLRKMQVFLFQVCPKCERFIIESGKLCQTCKRATLKNKDFFLDALVVAAKYKENDLSRIVHFYKYNLVQDLHIPLGRIMTKSFLDSDLPLPDLIVPVPLHPRRLRWRGFNQSELLANYISENLTPGLEIPVLNNVLFRKKNTTPQMKVRKYSERKENISDAFGINAQTADAKMDILKSKTILLIDDVATTGATLNECAKMLKQSGAKKVFGIVLARQEIKRIT